MSTADVAQLERNEHMWHGAMGDNSSGAVHVVVSPWGYPVGTDPGHVSWLLGVI